MFDSFSCQDRLVIRYGGRFLILMADLMSRGKKIARRSAASSAALQSPRSLLSDHRLRFAVSLLGGVLGGTVGALSGYYFFQWLKNEHGVYALVLPAVLLGMGCGLGLQRRVPLMGLICALAGCVFTLLLEWQSFPFADDNSFSYFLLHLNQKPPVKLGMFVMATVLAGWFGCGREE